MARQVDIDRVLNDFNMMPSDLAERLAVHRTTVYRWLREDHLSADGFLRLQDWLSGNGIDISIYAK